MGIFDEIQASLETLIELKGKIERLEQQIIKKTTYIGERLVGEQEFEKFLMAKKHDEEKNRKTNSEIQSIKDQYNKKFDDLCEIVESGEGALHLPNGLVLVRSGNTFEVYSHDTGYKIAQSFISGKSQFKKPMPDIHKRM